MPGQSGWKVTAQPWPETAPEASYPLFNGLCVHAQSLAPLLRPHGWLWWAAGPSLLVDGALSTQAHWHRELCQGHEKRG